MIYIGSLIGNVTINIKHLTWYGFYVAVTERRNLYILLSASKKMMVIALLKISMFYQGNMGGVNLKLVYVYLE